MYGKNLVSGFISGISLTFPFEALNFAIVCRTAASIIRNLLGGLAKIDLTPKKANAISHLFVKMSQAIELFPPMFSPRLEMSTTSLHLTELHNLLLPNEYVGL